MTFAVPPGRPRLPVLLRNCVRFGTFATGLAALSLTACTSPNCDPTQAGFVTGLGNAMSNCYANRNAAYQQQLDLSAAQRQQEQAHAADAAARSSAAQQNLAATQARLAAVDRDAAVMQGRLTALRNRVGVSQAALQQAQQAMDELQRRRAAAAATQTPEALQAMEAQHRVAQQRLRDLTAGQ